MSLTLSGLDLGELASGFFASVAAHRPTGYRHPHAVVRSP